MKYQSRHNVNIRICFRKTMPIKRFLALRLKFYHFIISLNVVKNNTDASGTYIPRTFIKRQTYGTGKKNVSDKFRKNTAFE